MTSDGLFGYDCRKMYGIEPMTVEQESSAPEPVKLTRQNKISMIDSCYLIVRMAQDMSEYVKRIPTENDPQHAALVQRLADKVQSARAAMELATLNKGGG